MTPSQQTKLNTAIAEWMGELDPNKCKPSIEQLEAILASKDKRTVVTLEYTGEIRSVKDRFSSLDACHDVVMRMDDNMLFKLVKHIRYDLKMSLLQLLKADAPTIAKAIAYALNLWDGKDE